MDIFAELTDIAEQLDQQKMYVHADKIMHLVERIAQAQLYIQDGQVLDQNKQPIPVYQGGNLPTGQTTAIPMDASQIAALQSSIGPDSPPMVVTSNGMQILFVHSSTAENGKKYYTIEPNTQVDQEEWQQYKESKGWSHLPEITCHGGAISGTDSLTNNFGETSIAIEPETQQVLIRPE